MFPDSFGHGPIRCSTFAVDVRVEHVSNPKMIGTRQEGDTILMIVSDRLSLDSADVQRALSALFRMICLREAARYLPGRLAEMERQTGLRSTDLRLTSARTRWGSCNSHGGINLSVYLMMLPVRMIDYIIVHELCHTREMNHGPRFKELWHSFFTDWRELDREKRRLDRATAWIKPK